MSRKFSVYTDLLFNSSFPAVSSVGSVSFWLRPFWSSGDSADHVFFEFSSNGTDQLPIFQKFSDNNIYAGFSGGGGGDQRIIISDSGLFSNNVWAHWAFTWTGGTNQILYKDGAQVGIKNSLTFVASTQINIGSHFASVFSNSSNFDIGEFAYWSGVQLSVREIQDLARGADPRSKQTSSLYGYWPINGTANPEPDSGSGNHQLAVTGTSQDSLPPSPADRTPPREATSGPPSRGSPWAVRLVSESDVPPPAPPPPPAVASQILPREVWSGPPQRGAPWAQKLIVQRFPPPPAPAPPPPVASPSFPPPEVRIGPPLRGSPLAQRLVVENYPRQAPPFSPGIPAVLPKVAGKPFLERVPAIKGPSAEERLRRHTEMLANVVNSLSASGQLIQTGSTQWKILAAGIASMGLTGTFNSGPFSGGGGGAGSGKTGTFNSGTF